jgi:hypothetical protein
VPESRFLEIAADAKEAAPAAETNSKVTVAMDDIAIARAIHVFAVVVWIGGVAMVTTVVLPIVRRGREGPFGAPGGRRAALHLAGTDRDPAGSCERFLYG